MKIMTGGNRQAAVTQNGGRPAIVQELHTDALQVVVPFRTIDRTAAALKFAAEMCEGLNWSVRLVDVQVVPVRCSMENPPINREFPANRLRTLAAEVTVPVRGDLVYARNWETGLDRSLAPDSLIVLAVRKGIWKTVEERLAERLTTQGHQVILVECK